MKHLVTNGVALNGSKSSRLSRALIIGVHDYHGYSAVKLLPVLPPLQITFQDKRNSMKQFIKIATEANISKYFSLEEIGIDNYAFPYQQAILLVDALRQSNVPILGGDVYLKLGSSIESSYDNWYCDKKEDEQDSVFVNRSCDVAETFIKEYKRKNAIKEPLFAFVIGENTI